ncbi:hypothetical protein ACKC9G_18575 [Pokkaliibacter sp. CJK22405]|uniref:hypothetical protein n=1 Tax=Pokkaliibacter sp. CJK22405 TaxID=3384615 RepID=UPI0039851ABD
MQSENHIILSFTRQAVADTSLSLDHFSLRVLLPKLAEHGLVDASADNVKQYESTCNRIRTRIRKIMTGDMLFPMEWKWPWINSLPAPYQDECRRSLAAIAGLLYIPAAALTESFLDKKVLAADIAGFMRETAEVLSAAAPAADGQYDHLDSIDECNRLIDELDDVISLATLEKLKITTATGAKGTRYAV